MNNVLLDNPKSQRIHHVAQLQQTKIRKKLGKILVEGPQAVRELVAYRYTDICDIYVTVPNVDSQEALSWIAENPTSDELHTFVTQHYHNSLGNILHDAIEHDLYLHFVTSEVMFAISQDSQGIVAVAVYNPSDDLLLPKFSADDKVGEHSEQPHSMFSIACWQVRDPGNLGAIIRTADAVGADQVILLDDCVQETNPKVIRSTVGSLFHIPVVHSSVENYMQWIANSHSFSIAADVYGTEEKPVQELSDFIYNGQTRQRSATIVFGNEARGLPQSIINACDIALRIPMYGRAESLNLATSVAVMSYSLVMSSHIGKMIS